MCIFSTFVPGDVSLTVKSLDVVRTRGYASLYADATATTGTCRFLGIFVVIGACVSPAPVEIRCLYFFSPQSGSLLFLLVGASVVPTLVHRPPIFWHGRGLGPGLAWVWAWLGPGPGLRPGSAWPGLGADPAWA